jgi:Trk K+ transport system NAD-binding subunit/NhaP-type Na+/H+ or K+/H+ antiporter
MDFLVPYLALFTALFLIVLAARQMGDIFARFNLPLISGFLFVGIIAGPFVLDFIHTENIPQFLLLDELALAFIAFAAGAELELQVIRGYFRSILALIGGQVVAILIIGVMAFVLLRDMIPFMAALPRAEILAVALLGATIMIARSPSSALAIIKELRARGPFTHKVLGATVLMDAVVIIIFAASVSVAAVLVEGARFDLALMLFVAFEVALDIGLGLVVGLLLHAIMHIRFGILKAILILLLGLGVFVTATRLHGVHPFGLPVGLFSEPLLICMTAGFYVTNFSLYAADFRRTVEELAPPMFLLFFTLVGVELELDVIWELWAVVLILFVVRVVGIFTGSFLGNALARDRRPANALLGFAFITQAGVSVGLAKEVGVEFPTWGAELAALSIGVIVLNQIVGPPLLKWAITRAGEAHTRAQGMGPEGPHSALIFGVEGQSLALARRLEEHEWQATLITRRPEVVAEGMANAPRIKVIEAIDRSTLAALGAARADAVVLMLADEESRAVCELIYEEFAVKNVIVRLQNRANAEKFQAYGAIVVEPGTAMVNLLDQSVRSPFAATLLLGMEPDQAFVEFEMRNPDLNGIAIRDIHFPHDVLIVAIHRAGGRLVTHGYTRLALGDQVSVVGSADSLAEVQVRFEG